tara:strand:- start:579 stop:743 length:165 start_codon:yes stop_codon:yes gene_type:complete
MIYLGYLMVAAPFALLFYCICRRDSVKSALIVFGACGILVAWIIAAVELMKQTV